MGATRLYCMIALILAGAAFLTLSMGYIGLPRHLAEWIATLGLSPFALIVALAAFYIVLGCFLDGISMVVLTMGVILPTVQKAGIDLLWFGIFIVVVVEMAQITPPVGFNLFVLQGMTRREMGYIAKAAFPFFLLMVLMVVLLRISTDRDVPADADAAPDPPPNRSARFRQKIAGRSGPSPGIAAPSSRHHRPTCETSQACPPWTRRSRARKVTDGRHVDPDEMGQAGPPRRAGMRRAQGNRGRHGSHEKGSREAFLWPTPPSMPALPVRDRTDRDAALPADDRPAGRPQVHVRPADFFVPKTPRSPTCRCRRPEPRSRSASTSSRR